jgi:hypothetical protein
MSATAPSTSLRLASKVPSAVSGSGDRYSLLEKLGSGGMGAVYKVLDKSRDRAVALKQLSAAGAGKKRRTLEVLFEREYHTLARLKHPRIIEVYDYGLNESGPYYTMELLDGQDLQQLAPLPYKTVCHHLRDIASSLALLHAHRLLHRDVSPRNVRLTQDGRAKLIDFGALTAFGPATDVVGTPPGMAPEVLRRMSLDQRADLFALGTVAYWALTARHAYPARRFDELAALWKVPPAAPSALVPGIPPALDALILSLLNEDPLARPSSAAAVIERLTQIGELPPEELEIQADSYLSSGRMVGRKREEEWVAARLARALDGSGGEILIEGATGVGKTRLLSELTLEAQLKGAVVLKADAHAASGFLGVAAVLAEQLLDLCPELARRAMGSHSGLLAHLSSKVEDKLGQRMQLTFDPNERRARFQAALHEWFLAVAKERTFVIAVDNLQDVDEDSAAFIAALGSRARDIRMLIVLTQRAGAQLVAKNSVQAVRKRCSRLKLAGLSASACQELVTSLFGDVANTGRLARVLFEKSAGNPQLCMDLAQTLVKKKIVRYAGGTWVLPLEVSTAELPSRVEEVLAAKLEGLSPSARDLAEALSIHVKPVPIEDCLKATSSDDDSAALAALDELVAEQILVAEGTSYRFAQELLREAVLAGLNEQNRTEKHRRAAETLLSSAGEDLDRTMEAAWHLLHSGEEGRGADLLARTGLAFLRAQGASAGVEHIVQALRTAVEVYERIGRSEYEIAALLFPLVPLGYFAADWRLVQQYGERSFRLGLKVTGLALADRLRPLFGRKLALKVGLWIAQWRFTRQKRRGLDYELGAAIAGFCAMVPATCGAFTACLDTPGVVRLAELLAPLRLFDDGQFPALMYAWANNIRQQAQGQSYAARLGYERMWQQFHAGTIRQTLGEGHFKSMAGGLMYARALLGCYHSSPEALTLAQDMEALGIRTWATTADQVRTLYHAYRGEIEEEQRYRARVDLFAAQGTATWQGELSLPALLLTADVLTGDTIGARRTWEQLARRADEIPTLQLWAQAAHAAYLMLRGALPAAIEAFECVLPEFPLRGRTAWLPMRAYFAQALNLVGQHARAKQVLTEALAQLDPGDDMIALSLEAHRQLALAEAGLGHHAEAERALDALLAQHGDNDNPLLIGLLHKARAEVALKTRDRERFNLHYEQVHQRFRATKNPALVAQWEHLGELALKAGLHPAAESAGGVESAERQQAASGARSIAELTYAPDRAEYALYLLLERSRARAGYLYLLEDGGWRLAAASSQLEPPLGLETQLKRQAGIGPDDSQLEDETGTVVQLASGATSAVTSGVESGVDRSPPRSLELEDATPTAFETTDSSPPAIDPDKDSDESTGEMTVFIASNAPSAAERDYRLIVLKTAGPEPSKLVGGVILEVDDRSSVHLSPVIIEHIATALQDRNTAITRSRTI